MDFQLTEEQEILKQVARDFFTKELPKSLIEEITDSPDGHHPELWQKMSELGWMGLIIPEKYGGFGGCFLDLTTLLEEIGRACLPGPFLPSSVLSALTIIEAGNERQRQELLRGIATGNTIVTVALMEPDTTTSLTDLIVEAKSNNEGYSINGTKLFIPYAHIADWLICVAKTGNNVTLFLVNAGKEGLSCSLLPTISWDRQCEVRFNNVKVEPNDILGSIDCGKKYMEAVLPKATIGMCAYMLGGAQRVLEMTVDYAKQRIQFGKPIGAQQAVQHHCANMAIDVNACRYIVSQAAWMLNEGLPCVKEVAMAKAWMNEAYERITSLGHQVHGAIAWQRDHSMHLYIKQAMLGKVSFGDTTYCEEIVARELKL
jgi:alkylation response protein AidB-like acyl-CoA dehydrogenase